MTDNNQQIDNTEKTEVNHKLSRRRRTLVKGAAGAIPVVLTLRSGAAIAASSVESCIVKDNEKAGTPAIKPDVLLIGGDTDTGSWVRKEGTCRTVIPKYSDDTMGTAFEIYTVTLIASIVEATVWQHEYNTPGDTSNGIYTYDSVNGPVYDPDTGGYMLKDGNSESTIVYMYSETATRSCRILVRVYPNTVLSSSTQDIGNDVVYDSNKLPYITGSCWTSIAPQTPLPL